MLAHPVIWFDQERRDALGAGIEAAVVLAGYTVWACAVLTNHLHLVIRTHRDDSLTMLATIAEGAFRQLHEQNLVPSQHPVWSERPYKVFLRSREQVYGRIDYVEQNQMKEGLPPRAWPFVTKCSL